MVTELLSYSPIYAQSSKVLGRFNICGRKGEKKESMKEEKDKAGKGGRITSKL